MNLLPFFLLACPLLFVEAADEDELVLVQAVSAKLPHFMANNVHVSFGDMAIVPQRAHSRRTFGRRRTGTRDGDNSRLFVIHFKGQIN